MGVTQACRKPGTGLVERRRRQTRPSLEPLIKSPFCLLFQRMKLGRHAVVVFGIRPQWSCWMAKSIRSHREADFNHRCPDPGRREEQRHLNMVLQVLANVW